MINIRRLTGIKSRIGIIYLLLLIITYTSIGIVNAQSSLIVSSGRSHTLALTSDGNVWAWGSNTMGECGYTESSYDHSNILSPVQVPIVDIKAIIAGNRFSMALKNDGTVWTWGDNERGQLGIGMVDDNPHPTPVMVQGLTDIVAIDTRDQLVLALDKYGYVWSWGSDSYGQLGDGKALPKLSTFSLNQESALSSSNRSIPGKVRALDNVKSIYAGGNYALAVKDDGSIWGWGFNSSILGKGYGELNDEIGTSSPILVQKMASVKAIGSASGSALALMDNGSVWGWGKNNNYILGSQTIGLEDTVIEPVRIAGLVDIKSIGTGAAHSVFVDENGDIWTMGANYYGQLGCGDKNISGQPYKIPIDNITSISVGTLYTIAVSKDGSLFAWGSDNNGELGDGATGADLYRNTPIYVTLNLEQLNNTPVYKATITIQPSITSDPSPSPMVNATEPIATDGFTINLTILAIIMIILAYYAIDFYQKEK